MGALSGDPGADAEDEAPGDGEPATFDELLRRAAAARTRHAEGPDHDRPGAAAGPGEDGADASGDPPS